jgi:hypothetical protein
MVEAAGIEPASDVFEKRRRRATFVVNSEKGNELRVNSLSPPVPWSPLESSPVLEKCWQAAGQVSRRLADFRGSALPGRNSPRFDSAVGELTWPPLRIAVPRRLRYSRRHPHDRLRSAPSRRDCPLPGRRRATRDFSHPGRRPQPPAAALRRARVPALTEVRDLRSRFPAGSL